MEIFSVFLCWEMRSLAWELRILPEQFGLRPLVLSLLFEQNWEAEQNIYKTLRRLLSCWHKFCAKHFQKMPSPARQAEKITRQFNVNTTSLFWLEFVDGKSKEREELRFRKNASKFRIHPRQILKLRPGVEWNNNEEKCGLDSNTWLWAPFWEVSFPST